MGLERKEKSTLLPVRSHWISVRKSRLPAGNVSLPAEHGNKPALKGSEDVKNGHQIRIMTSSILPGNQVSGNETVANRNYRMATRIPPH